MDQELDWFANASATDACAFIAAGISDFSSTQSAKFEQRQRSKKQLEFAFTSGRISAVDKERYDAAQSSFEEQCRITDTHNDVLIILAVLGSRIVRLGVVNHSQIIAANSVVRQAFGNLSSSMLYGHYDQLASSVQIGVVVGMVFCAECYPMHIWRGFATGVRANWEKFTPWTNNDVYDTLDQSIAFLKSTPRNFALLKKLPEGIERFSPWDRGKEKSQNEKVWKEGKKDRKALEESKKDFNKRVEKKGFPQPIDKSFVITSWSLPFATWNSPFVVNNEGHSWMNILRYQMDPGRLLHAFVVGGHLMLREGEVMVIPAGPAECLVRWLEGLDGITFKLIPESKLDFRKLGLKSSTKKSMKNIGTQDAYAIRDAAAVARKNEHSFAHPAPMPPISPGNVPSVPKMPWERKEPGANFKAPPMPNFTTASPTNEDSPPPPQYASVKPDSPVKTSPRSPLAEMNGELSSPTNSPITAAMDGHTKSVLTPTAEQARMDIPKMPIMNEDQSSTIPIRVNTTSSAGNSAQGIPKMPSMDEDAPFSNPPNPQNQTQSIPKMPSMENEGLSPYTTQPIPSMPLYSGNAPSYPLHMADRRSVSFPTAAMNAQPAGLDRRSSMMGSVRRKAVSP